MILRTGIDIIEIDRLEQIQPAIKARFLKRVYTPTELEQIGQSASSLAGRFAAKEAVAKALGCGIGLVHWQEIEIQRGADGQPVLVLYGQAKQIAQNLGIITWSVSISHSQTQAIAMAVGLGAETKG